MIKTGDGQQENIFKKQKNTIQTTSFYVFHHINGVTVAPPYVSVMCLGPTRRSSTKLSPAGLFEWSTWWRSYWTTMANATGKLCFQTSNS